ncbi:MAG: acetolactate synthase small subunit [Clostridiales bacterium]|nr:acetolactate synthase small subunit [Clostridiales bacterium]
MKREFDNEKKLYTLSLLVKDIPGVMSQVSRLFSRKGYNIESIATGASSEPGVTRITIVIKGDELMIDQIAAQCRKLLPVLAVKVLDADSSIQREVALIKVQADDMVCRGEIIQIAELFRANIIDVSRDALTVATFGTGEKVEALMNLLQEFGILEVVRTGTIAIERGRSTIYDQTKLKEEYNYGKNVL